MKLEKFKEKNNKKIGIILFTITCILLISGVLLYRTFAIFETNDEFNVINGSVEDMGDVQFVFYIEDEISKKAPEISSNYSLDTTKSHCTNGAFVHWDDTTGRAEVDNLSDSKTKCYLYFKEIYKEEILHGAIPDLGNGRLIPITISNSEKPSDLTNYTNTDSKYGGRVYKADITDSWYSYGEHRWANAVILKDGEVDHYKPGDEIQESAIESYFVWIPRYKYQLKEDTTTYNNYSSITETFNNLKNAEEFYSQIGGNKGESNPFEIEFESKESGNKQGSKKGEYLTHPAFVTFNSNGMWVGKFETGYNQNDDTTSVTINNNWSTSGAQKNEQLPNRVIIKPNVYSWRNIQPSNAFYTSYEYMRDLESHMMKNTEWGAVAYLTQSKYGRCINNKCDEVRINNNGNFVTGYVANFISSCGWTGTNETCNQYENTVPSKDGTYGDSYYNSQSVVASTTGNYYGVFDMSGGSYEYVMGVMQAGENDTNPASGRNELYNSGFKGKYSCYNCDDQNKTENVNGLPWPSSKYYDLYDYSSSRNQYQKGILGDATKESGPFYSVDWPKTGGTTTNLIGSFNADAADFLSYTVPWIRRGGSRNDGTNAGVFAFSVDYGCVETNASFRLVLMP